MQYVRSISGSVSTTWNSINPATLSGAIDVIVVEQEDGSLACSPFHVRFGKFSLLRPSEKKVEFRVSNVKQDYAMKLGDGGEAFFVFETSNDIPEGLQTSPLVSPASSPPLEPEGSVVVGLQEPDFLDLTTDEKGKRPPPSSVLQSPALQKEANNLDIYGQLAGPPEVTLERPRSGDWSGLSLEPRAASDRFVEKRRTYSNQETYPLDSQGRSVVPALGQDGPSDTFTERSQSPPLPTREAIERAISLSKQLAVSNIPSHVTDTGDLMLDMTGYKSSDDDALRAEVIARKLLSEELEGNYDIGALIGADEQGNLWIYSSEEAKEAAVHRAQLAGIRPAPAILTSDVASDPGYHSDGGDSDSAEIKAMRLRSDSDQFPGLEIPLLPLAEASTAGDPNRNYAKTLRLTSDQLKALNLQPGPNMMSFTVNRATCTAYMYLWRHDVPIVISDIDGTITKSDALGHVLNMIGRDWTHIGVAKLYTEIEANGYNIMYLTSRSVGLADTTRAYVAGVVQDGYRLPRGPTIMSPDRTIAALRRELYIRKPEVFKMACLRDIKNLYGDGRTPFYAGFGNRLTDALSYRSVSIPSNRIFTINSYAEVSLDLLSLNKLKLSYVNMREVVDHYFPPVSMLIKGGGEEFTDFNYWRDKPMEMEDFSASEDEDEDKGEDGNEGGSERGSDDGDDDRESGNGDDGDEDVGDMGDSYISRDSIDEYDEEDGEEYDEEDDTADISNINDDADESAAPLLEDMPTPVPQGDRDATPSAEAVRSPSRGGYTEDPDADLISGMEGLMRQEESPHVEQRNTNNSKGAAKGYGKDYDVHGVR
ncbi:hypothetical protein VC83_01316 [Pseudogymnoascus destructans]|uniref:LNS2/PITP domain-containing protein n=2 Tax=Pseudogymnoascus destructans TaxID=655981 RepID=L8G2T6_PSED2|nr:uncharacterized protein VC83_01316 [Pseudogymnoascus destructans]ELR06301.1 hypothetical protein GMDG_07892 [Pseudogymnoascus destructans 20631-21]OAF62605.1 hypothetical protein VC83_01316 [Pseudogymnoascus destructans]